MFNNYPLIRKIFRYDLDSEIGLLWVPRSSPQLFHPTRSGPLMMGLPVAAAMDLSMP
jgi:hypothetical protein